MEVGSHIRVWKCVFFLHFCIKRFPGRLLDKPRYQEKELFQHTAEEDKEAFSALFHLHTDNLYTYILKLQNQIIWAEELVRDVWTQVWLHRRKITRPWPDPVALSSQDGA